MKLALPALALLLMGIEALASTTNSQTYNGNNNTNSGGDQTGNRISTQVKVHPRTLKSLFQRDPDFEFAMGILGKIPNPVTGQSYCHSY